MRSRVAVLSALAAVTVSGLAPAPAWPVPERRAPIVSAVDDPGDVVVRDVAGPSDEQRRSVDLIGFKAAESDDLVRITVGIARVTTSHEFDQLIEVVFLDEEPGLPDVSGRISLRVQHNGSGTAEASVENENSGSGTFCIEGTFQVLRAKGQVRLRLHRDCLPPGALGIRVKSFTVTPKGERRTIYSRDFLRVPGSHDLGGLAGSEDPARS